MKAIMLKVKYIGQKASQTWMVGGRNLLWEKYGTVLDVPEDFARTINSHPGNWEIVGRTDTAEPVVITEEPDTRPPLLDINSMDKSGLISYIQRELGQEVDGRWSAERLRKYVQDRIAQRAYE